MSIHESETVDLEATTTSVYVLPTCCVGDTLSDRYRLDEEIGRGGMGIVFRAWDVVLERPVAVKVLSAQLEVGDARDRLFREARAAAALSHPHVVSVHDVGEHRHMPYLVMELIEGPSLKERKPETLEETIEIATLTPTRDPFDIVCQCLSNSTRFGNAGRFPFLEYLNVKIYSTVAHPIEQIEQSLLLGMKVFFGVDAPINCERALSRDEIEVCATVTLTAEH